MSTANAHPEVAPAALYLTEIAVSSRDEDVPALRARVEELVQAGGGAVVESVWAGGLSRLYVIVQGSTAAALTAAFQQRGLELKEIVPVRPIGPPAGRAASAPSHLVEWDLPADLGMEKYLKRKAEKSPLYARVPEVQFLRTYVREDTVKCLCLYDAPDEEAVRRARDAVGAPISRLSQVDDGVDRTQPTEASPRTAGAVSES